MRKSEDSRNIRTRIRTICSRGCNEIELTIRAYANRALYIRHKSLVNYFVLLFPQMQLLVSPQVIESGELLTAGLTAVRAIAKMATRVPL